MSVRGFSIKKMMPRTLFGRSLLILVLPVVLIQAITAYVFFERHWTRVTSRLALAVAGEIATLGMVVEDGYEQEFFKYFSQNTEMYLDLSVDFKPGATLLDLPDRRFPDIWQSMVTDALTKELSSMIYRPFTVQSDLQEKWVRVRVQLKNGVLEVDLPSRRLFSSSSYIFLLWMIGTSAVLLLVAVLFMRNQIRPIRRLAVVAERFGKGRDVGSFKPSGAREVRQASEAFLDMHRRIRRQIEQRTLMLAGVSHDLRTPLTRLKLQVEMLGNTPDVQAMKSDLADMERMIGGYLDFVRGEGDEDMQSIQIGELVEKVSEKAARQGIALEADVDVSVPVTVRPMAFERCLVNLVNNAGQHASHVWLKAFTQDRRLNIVIEDDGPGIHEDQYEDVFRPFFRIDAARSAGQGSVGLGLPIAQDIVHSHGGQITLGRSEKGGLSVLIRVPL